MYLIDKTDDLTSVGLRGELDSQGVGEVETRFTATICPAGKNALVDFSEVTFLASLGLRMLVSVSKALAAKGARLVIHSPQEMVRESIVAASLDQVIPLADSAEQARELLDG
jgi:anti-anti-sigma factor